MPKQKKTAEVTGIPEPERFHTLSVDLGNAYSNAQGDNGLKFDFRSIVAPLSDANRLGDWPIEDVIVYEKTPWIVGDKCYTLAALESIQENPTVNRYRDPWYRRLFAFALHKAFYKMVGQEIIYPRIIASVPASLFKNREETDAIKNNLSGDYEIGNVYGGAVLLTVNPRHLVLIPEGIGTYFSYVFGPGNNSLYESGTWLIADSGYLTLDCVMVRDGEYIPDMARSDEKTGISIVSEALRDFIYTRSRVRLDRATIDKNMLCDAITVNQKTISIEQARNDALAQIGKRATMLLEQWAAGQNLTGILLTGGGADHLHGFIQSESLPSVTLVPNGRRANVEGAYLYAVSR